MSGANEIAVATFHALNKKTERALYTQMKEKVIERVRSCTFDMSNTATENGEIFSLLCTLVIHCLFHVHLELNGKSVSAVVQLLNTPDLQVDSLLLAQVNSALAIVSSQLQQEKAAVDEANKYESNNDATSQLASFQLLNDLKEEVLKIV